MRFFILILAFLLPLIADEIVIDAQELNEKEKSKVTQLKGNVQITRLHDKLNCDEAYIFLDKNNKPTKMQALGNVKFWLTLENNRKIQGKANELLYFPNTQEYQIIGSAFVEEPAKKNEVKGEKIIIRYKEGYINIVGDDKAPARLIFKLDKEAKK